MGYDDRITLLEPAEQARFARLYYDRFESLIAELSDPPDWMVGTHRHFEETVDFLNKLDTPPEINEYLSKTLLDLRILPRIYAVPSLSTIAFWNWRSKVVIEKKVPEFIGARSNRGETLWRKLTGTNDVYEVDLNSGRYRFEPHRAGYLSTEERQELADELRPIIPDIGELYNKIDSEYDYVAAREMHIVEFVQGLCIHGGSGAEGLAYEYTQ